MRHALIMLCVLRRASTLLRPPALSSSTALFATDASRALERRFDAALKDDCGVRANDTVVAAVSGGVDSTCLLHLLARAECRVKVVTFDHRQRGAASTEDAAFVQRLAARYGLECDTHVWEGGKGTADQFRNWRRRTLLETAKGDHVATAHHADDEAELFLLRLSRGARLTKVLGGMRMRKETFIRPLLREPKRELRQYLEDNNEEWRDDASNADPSYGKRNRARLEVVPPLDALCEGGLSSKLDNLRRQAEAVQTWIDREADTVLAARRSGALPLAAYREAPAPVRLEVLDRLAAAAAATDGSYAVPYSVLCDADAKLCGGEAEWTLHLPRGVLLKVGHGALSCAEPPPSRSVGRVSLDGRLGYLSVALDRGLAVPAPADGALDLRPRQAGDRFRAPWRDAPQKLSTVLRGQRVRNADDRAATVVLACGERVLAAFPPAGDALVCAAEDGDGEVLVDVASTSSVGGDA